MHLHMLMLCSFFVVKDEDEIEIEIKNYHIP